MASADPNSDWALVLSAFPLTGNDMKELIARVSAEDLPPGLAIPKVLILLGPLTLEQRRQLIRQAAVYVPCPSPYHETLGILDAVTPLLTSPAALHAFLTLPD